MVVGANSYLTVEEADAYVEAHYFGEKVVDLWLSLSIPSRERILILACRELERLPFTGCKKIFSQPLMFPRKPYDSVPEDIKAAQVEIALIPIKRQGSASDQGNFDRIALQRQGVSAFSIGDLSESYTGVSSIAFDYPFMADNTVSHIVTRYISGGYATC